MRRGSIWVLLLWIGLAVAGGVLIYFFPPRPILFWVLCVNTTCSGPTAAQLLTAMRPQLASLWLEGMLAVVCLAGLWLVSSRLLRAAFLLQLAAMATALVFWLPVPPLSPGQSGVVLFLIPTLLVFPSSLLTAASLVVLSWGIARWQRPGKGVLIVLQALLALLLGGALVISTLRLPQSATNTPLDGLFSGGTLATTSGWLLLVLLVVRWECWKHRPLVMACVFAGQLAWLNGRLASLLSDQGLLSSQALGTFLLSYAPSIEQLTPLLFALGILLLIWSERASQRGQGAPITGPAPALEGGAAGAPAP